MEIKKNFSDIGSIIKSLMKHIDLMKVYIKVCADPAYPGQICVGIFAYNASFPIVYYTWMPGKVQTLYVPDEICQPHVFQKKVRVKSAFAVKPRFG